MNSTVLIACTACLIAAIVLDGTIKLPLGITCLLSAFLINYFAFGTTPNQTLEYFPTALVMSMLLAMLFFSVFTSNGTSEYIARIVIGFVKGNMKLYPWLLFVLTMPLYVLLEGSALRFVIVPLVFSVAKAGGGSTLMAISTAHMPLIAGSLNSFLGIDASTRMGILTDMGIENVSMVNTGIWLNCLLAILICHAVIYVITGSWKVPNAEFSGNAENLSMSPVQKKSILLLIVTVVVFVVPAILRVVIPVPFTRSLSSVLNNYTIFSCAILAVVLLKLDDWKRMTAKVSIKLLMMVIGVTFLVKTAQAAGLQEVCLFIAQSVPQWSIAPVMLLICATLSFFVSSATILPVMLPLAAAVATTPSEAITYMSCVALGMAAAGVSPLSGLGAGHLAVVAEEDRERYSKYQFMLAFIGPMIMAAVAATGGMSLFSGMFAKFYF